MWPHWSCRQCKEEGVLRTRHLSHVLVHVGAWDCLYIVGYSLASAWYFSTLDPGKQIYGIHTGLPELTCISIALTFIAPRFQGPRNIEAETGKFYTQCFMYSRDPLSYPSRDRQPERSVSWKSEINCASWLFRLMKIWVSLLLVPMLFRSYCWLHSKLFQLHPSTNSFCTSVKI